jgi:hypothetical protein
MKHIPTTVLVLISFFGALLPVQADSIVWRGTVSTNWDTTTANWTNLSTATGTTYADGDDVSFFTHTTILQSNVFINGTVTPGSVLISNATTKTLTFWGGDIAGLGGLVKANTGTATFGNSTAAGGDSRGYLTSLSFAGGTLVKGGTLEFFLGTNSLTTTRSVSFGTGTITVDGATFRFSGSSTASGQTNILQNHFSITSNGGTIIFSRNIANPKHQFTGNFTLGTNASVRLNAGSGGGSGVVGGNEFSGTWTLNGSNSVSWISGSGNTTLRHSGNFVDGGSAGTLLLSNSQARVWTLSGTGNTYSGGTVIHNDGQNLNLSSFVGAIEVGTLTSLGTGDVKVEGGGLLRLMGDDNLAASAELRLERNTGLVGSNQFGFVWSATNVTNIIAALYLDGVEQAAGVYTASSNPDYFGGLGAIVVIPEPSTITLVAAGLIGGLLLRRRHRS